MRNSLQSVESPLSAYRPIPQGWTRVLDLISEPGKALQCRLRHINLQHPEIYIALSYVWGSSSNPFSMHISDDRSHGTSSSRTSGTISLTQSLYDALQDLRDCEDIQPKTFWIDQICINQRDDEERSCQVAQMHKVFHNATQVITYLGPWKQGDDEALDLMLRIYHHFEPLTRNSELDGIFNHSFADKGISIYGKYRRMKAGAIPVQLVFPDNLFDGEQYSIFKSLDRILSGPWTERLWLVQENVLNMHTTYLRGHQTISWATIRLVCGLSAAGLVPWIERRNEILELFRRRATWHRRNDNEAGALVKEPLYLDSLVQLASLRTCNDPKDRIYAVLGLAADVEELRIVPDYTKSAAQVFTDLSVAFTRRELYKNHAYCLVDLEKSNASYNDADGMEYDAHRTIPSWAPAYSYGGICTKPDHMHINASQTQDLDGIPRALAKLIDFEPTSTLVDGMMVVKGMRLSSSLDECFGTFPWWMLSGSLNEDMLNRYESVLQRSQAAIGGLESQRGYATIFEALTMGHAVPNTHTELLDAEKAGALCKLVDRLRCAQRGDRVCNREHPDEFYLPDAHGPVDSQGATNILWSSARLFENRSLWMTNDRRLCLTTKRVRKNDIAAILFGGRWIYFLRPSGDFFEYVGWGYVTGCMQGEPLGIIDGMDSWIENVETFRLI